MAAIGEAGICVQGITNSIVLAHPEHSFAGNPVLSFSSTFHSISFKDASRQKHEAVKQEIAEAPVNPFQAENVNANHPG